jgi:hypothetical protein
MGVEPGGSVLVVDYKTNRLEDRDPRGVVDEEYALQRAVYALACLRGGAPAVETAWCLLERDGRIVGDRYLAADAGALAERLREQLRRSAGVDPASR